MAKKRAPKHAPKHAPKAISSLKQQDDEYDMKRSRQRLEDCGFDPAVCTLSPEQVVERWWKALQRHGNQLTKDASNANAEPQTRAILLLRQQNTFEPCRELHTLEGILAFPDVGTLILQNIFANGYKTVLSFALASKRAWHIAFSGTNYWDFYAGRHKNIASAGIFISATPEYTIREMNISRLIDPNGLGLAGPAEEWHTGAISREEDIINNLTMIRTCSGPVRTLEANRGHGTPPPPFIARTFDSETIHKIRSIKNVDKMWRASQFTANPPASIFKPQMIYAATHLQTLLLQILRNKNAIKVLYFQKTPFLDRRILSIILRACPQLVMVGIYDCPLLHFGDVLCLLDLIHEINSKRQNEKAHKIHSLDFYPHGKGMSPDGFSSITADLIDLDILQRGFYDILLKSFLKAKKMNLGLLFAEGKAFRSFLFQVPNPPLSIPSFLDAIERHTKMKRTVGSLATERQRAIYDLLKPVRLGTDWTEWIWSVMGNHLVFCSSCGYEVLPEFIPAGARRMRPHRRLCAGCTLQHILDSEPQESRREKHAALSVLFPGWKRDYFNEDAPLCSGADYILKLRSSSQKRPDISALQEAPNGGMTARPYLQALVRDNKFHFDSIQGLPTLEGLLAGDGQKELWREFFRKSNDHDLLSRAKRRLRDEMNEEESTCADNAAEVSVTGTPAAGPMDDIWRRGENGQEVPGFTYTTALTFHTALVYLGW